jgi:hypothetical protein
LAINSAAWRTDFGARLAISSRRPPSMIALAHFVNGNDARAFEACGGFRFATEAFHMRFRSPMA